MLTLKNHWWFPGFFMGYSAVLDEDWEDFLPPPLTTATCWEQYEGHGRNNFGIDPSRWLSDPEARTPRPPKPPWERKPRSRKLRPPEPPLRHWETPHIWLPFHLQESPRPEIVPGMLPLRRFCMICGYRQGGPDSWDGMRCKCGTNSPPLRSKSGEYFYEKGSR